MVHLGVELHAEPFARAIGHRRVRRVGAGGDGDEAARQFVDAVAVAHPDDERLFGIKPGEQIAAVENFQFGAAVFALDRPRDLAAADLGQQLHPVADAQHRHAELKDERVALRRVFFVHARRPAG